MQDRGCPRRPGPGEPRGPGATRRGGVGGRGARGCTGVYCVWRAACGRDSGLLALRRPLPAGRRDSTQGPFHWSFLPRWQDGLKPTLCAPILAQPCWEHFASQAAPKGQVEKALRFDCVGLAGACQTHLPPRPKRPRPSGPAGSHLFPPKLESKKTGHLKTTVRIALCPARSVLCVRESGIF